VRELHIHALDQVVQTTYRSWSQSLHQHKTAENYRGESGEEAGEEEESRHRRFVSSRPDDDGHTPRQEPFIGLYQTGPQELSFGAKSRIVSARDDDYG
jgi:hypothetical protein